MNEWKITQHDAILILSAPLHHWLQQVRTNSLVLVYNIRPIGVYRIVQTLYSVMACYRLACTRGTPRVQFANIRKMVLCQCLPRCLRLCVDPFMARHAQSLNSSLHAWPQNLEAFQTTRKRAKKGQMWLVLLFNIRFLWFLQSMFL